MFFFFLVGSDWSPWLFWFFVSSFYFIILDFGGATLCFWYGGLLFPSFGGEDIIHPQQNKKIKIDYL